MIASAPSRIQTGRVLAAPRGARVGRQQVEPQVVPLGRGQGWPQCRPPNGVSPADRLISVIARPSGCVLADNRPARERPCGRVKDWSEALCPSQSEGGSLSPRPCRRRPAVRRPPARRAPARSQRGRTCSALRVRSPGHHPVVLHRHDGGEQPGRGHDRRTDLQRRLHLLRCVLALAAAVEEKADHGDQELAGKSARAAAATALASPRAPLLKSRAESRQVNPVAANLSLGALS